MDPYVSHFEQTGGFSDLRIGPVYRASFRKQSGRGLGSILKNIVSFVSPLFKTAAGHLGKEFLDAGSNIVSDIAHSDTPPDIRQIAKRRFTESRDKLVRKMKGGKRRRRAHKKKRVTVKTHWQKGGARRRTRKKTYKRRVTRNKADIFSGL